MTLTLVNGRLPAIAIPKHYAIHYTSVDLVGFTFEGQVQLELKSCVEVPSHSSIVLHTRELQLSKATLKNKATGEEYKAVEFRYQLHHETCEVVFDASQCWIPNTDYTLTMTFHGLLNDQMAGFYRSQYTNLQGQRITMATTQFEPTDARRAFPCFDEPALKATFQLQVDIPAHLQAISNTPVTASHTRRKNDNTTLLTTITFATTPQMSTYLVALVIGEFDSISCTSPKSRIQTTVYTVPGKAFQGQFCLTTASACLDFFQDIYGIQYPLIKSDLLAIPDFAAGAMENWGCVTYREAKILITESTSETIRRGIARTVCHELAHQWFGNLTTPEFWTQLWLKEGVARFMEFVALDHLFPEWKAWDEFVQGVMSLALHLDALKSSHPVEVPVQHSNEISEIFDSISYAKGASIIRMLANYIGMEDFMKGMRLYLTRHAYGNAVSEDFWKALSEAAGGKPLVEFMKPWTLVMGFPMVQLEGDDGSTTSIVTRQFQASGEKENGSTQWPIPVTARVQGMDGVQGPWVLHGPDRDESEALSKQIQSWSAEGKWFKLNADQFGFYRVNYTPDQWRRLSQALDPNSGALSATDRLGLISDSFEAGKAGYASIVDSLKLVEGFGQHETAGR
jgi:puromycin-sensitive aminopeptidase